VLEGLPDGRNGIGHGGLRHLQNGVYAVVESSNLEEDVGEVKRSDLFMPIRKEVGIIDDDGAVLSRVLYLADTDAITRPCCVVPDIGGPPNRYFVVKPRNEWPREFTYWLEEPHRYDEMDSLGLDDEIISDSDEEDGSDVS
jgi:hypothetical protein